MELGERLRTIAEMVPPGTIMADIGTDHAYLPVWLVQSGVVSRAIAGEINPGPLESARQYVLSSGHERSIDVRFGDGLAVLTPGEAEVAVIAGMGASTMISIFEHSPDVLRELKRVILQPMVVPALVRRWLHQHGWRLAEERLVEDAGRVYEILAAEPGCEEIDDPILYEIGPRLWEQRPPLLERHIQNLLRQYAAVLDAMRLSERAVQSPKYAEVRNKVARLEEKRQCL